MENKDTKAVTIRQGTALAISSVTDLATLGKFYESSGMLGCTQPGQGIIVAMHCIMTGQSPLELKEEFHLTGGNLSKRSDAMLASLIDNGGSYKILCRDSEKASIEATCGEATGVSGHSAWNLELARNSGDFVSIEMINTCPGAFAKPHDGDLETCLTRPPLTGDRARYLTPCFNETIKPDFAGITLGDRICGD